MGSVYLIRHGQASFGARDYDRLSSVGVQQARVLGEALGARALRPALVVCGSMRRHRQTAIACLEGMGQTHELVEDPGFNEYDHQAMLEGLDPRYRKKSALAADLLREGNLRRAFQQLFSRAASRWASGSFDDDYDESFEEFAARLRGSLSSVCAQLGEGESALVFSSGGAISALLAPLLGLSPERTMELSYTLVNSSVSKLLLGARGTTLSTLNEHSHLEQKDPRLVTYR